MSMLLGIYTHICVCIDTLLVFYRSEVSALLLGFILHVCSDALCIVSFSAVSYTHLTLPTKRIV
mgnify:CR=1 FL=1